MVTRYRKAYSQLEKMERKFFGEHSYFYRQEHGLETGSEDTDNEGRRDGNGGSDIEMED